MDFSAPSEVAFPFCDAGFARAGFPFPRAPLSFEGKATMTDTRKDKRAPISLKVRFKSATVDEFIEQYSKDISKGGIFIKSNKNSPPMPIGTLLKFEFQLKDESKLIQGVGRVVWKRELEGSSDDDPAGMGIKFIKMDGDSKGLVDQIVAGRGEAPGQFEAGGGAALKDEGEPAAAPAAAPSTTSSSEGKRPVRSAKATMQFFPSTTPQNELPKPEDRTQVRHASEFLASALSSAGVDEATTGEADKKAEEARARSEEIEREREEQARKVREEEDKKARAEKERQEREKAEAEEKAAAAAKEAEKEAERKKEQEKKDKEKAAAAAAPASEGAAKKKTSDRPPAKDDKKAAAPAAAAKKAEPKAAVAVAPPPAPETGSNMMPIFAGVLVVAALGAWYMFGRGGEATDDSQLPPPPPSTAAEPPPPPPPPTTDTVADVVDDGTVDVVDDGTDAVDDGTVAVDDGTEPPTSTVEPPPPAVTHDIRVDTTPAAATIVVDGEERGAAPQTLTLAEGDHTVEARLAGYRTATQTVHSADGARPVRMALTALPYVVHVTTTPPGARVRIGGRTVTSPGDATIPRPTAPLTATATLAGYLDGTQRLEVSAFTQGDDAMSADLAITLAPRPAAPPPTTGVRRPPPTTTATRPPPTTTETTPPPETTAEEHHSAPPPASEAPPDNPF